jgi:hypothetical protein
MKFSQRQLAGSANGCRKISRSVFSAESTIQIVG